MVDTMIVLFDSTSMSFTTNGLGCLSDAISCIVTEERNGEFELEMEYPVTGQHYGELALRRIIVAKSNPYSEKQAFRIYSITKPMNGIVTVNAAHISYDLAGYPVSPFTAESVPNALVLMKGASAVPCPFTFYTDKSTAAKMTVVKPSTIRSLLGGSSGSLLDIYGGEYEFDNFMVKLLNNRGANRGVSIRYGKNLTDLEQEENCSNVYTGVYPYWYSEQDGLLQLPEKIIKCEGTYNFTRIYPLDLSDKWQQKPTEKQIRDTANAYIKSNKVGIPKVSLKISFVQMAQSEEYKDITLLEAVHLCDSVNVEFPEYNVSAVSKCISTTYDVITDMYKEIELGDARSNLASTLSAQNQAINEAPSRMKTVMERAIENATQLITGGLGGYVVMRDSSGGKYPDEILIMDTPDIKTAKKVWRWNKAGLGYSSTGYNGPYGLAMTQNGAIVADFITTGVLTANLIQAGILQSSDGETFYLDLENGILRMMAESLTIGGKTINQIAEKAADNAVDGQTQEDIFNKLTNNGAEQGLYIKDGKLYINASYMKTGTLNAKDVNVINIKASNIAAGFLSSFTIETPSKNTDSGTIVSGLNSDGLYSKKMNGDYRGLYTSKEGSIGAYVDGIYVVEHRDGVPWGNPLAIINLSTMGLPWITLKDRSNRTRCQVGLSDDGSPSIYFKDTSNVVRCQIGLDSSGYPNICLYDSSGVQKSFLGLYDSPGHTMLQFGKNGRNPTFQVFEDPSVSGGITMTIGDPTSGSYAEVSKAVNSPGFKLVHNHQTVWEVYSDYSGNCVEYKRGE